MKRYNYTNEGTITEFKNGNINITLSDDVIKKAKQENNETIEPLIWLLDSLDISIIGEEFCLSNYDMGCMLYNCYADKCYILAFSDIDKKLMEGKTLKLYSFEPSEDDRQQIENEY